MKSMSLTAHWPWVNRFKGEQACIRLGGPAVEPRVMGVGGQLNPTSFLIMPMNSSLSEAGCSGIVVVVR